MWQILKISLTIHLNYEFEKIKYKIIIFVLDLTNDDSVIDRSTIYYLKDGESFTGKYLDEKLHKILESIVKTPEDFITSIL